MGISNRLSPPPQGNSLQVPPARRIALPVSERLTTITEGANARKPGSPSPDVPPRNPARKFFNYGNSSTVAGGASVQPPPRPVSTASLTPQSRWSMGGSSMNTQGTQRTAPPAYEWIPEPIPGEDDGNAPVEGEKLAALRRRRGSDDKNKGGWGRLALILAIVLIMAIALGVGLGVGLTRHKKHNNDSSSGSSSGSGSDNKTALPFPLGEYSIVTALRTTNTDCASNTATWRCYPYTVWSESTANSSMATFNWIITNTSSLYATNTTHDSTPDSGINSNLTISSDSQPFSIAFTNSTLTYISPANNASQARYTFSFNEHKTVVPTTQLTADNSRAECFFNQTTFTGTLYLDKERTYPVNEADAGPNPWPWAVEVEEMTPSAADTPACYKTDSDGGLGERITDGVGGGSGECSCVYRSW